MKRTKRFTIRRIALSLAVAAVVAPSAQAKPTPAKQQQPSRVEIPYLSHGVLTPPVGVDDRSFSKATSVGGTPVSATDTGYDAGTGTIGAAGLALILAVGGAGLAIRHSRGTRISPA